MTNELAAAMATSDTSPPAAASGAPRVWSRVGDYGIVIATATVFAVLSLTADNFLTSSNLINILDQWAPIGIIACAGTLVIIGGAFDLAPGAIGALAGLACAQVSMSGDVVLGLFTGLAVGLVLGLLNGLIVTVGRVNSFIGTLASSFVLRGLAITVTGGAFITVKHASFTNLGLDRFLGIPWSIWILAVFALALSILLTRTTFGRYIRAIGGNEQAARFSGVNVTAVRTATFVISGMAGALAGMIIASRSGTAQADAATGVELTAIAAIVIGGTSIFGGEGAIWRTVLGVLLIAMIGNGFVLLSIDTTYQLMVQGMIIIIAVILDARLRKRDTR